MKGPALILKAEDSLYPRYDLWAKIGKFLDESRRWLKAEAEKLLKEHGRSVHPDVLDRWNTIAKNH